MMDRHGYLDKVKQNDVLLREMDFPTSSSQGIFNPHCQIHKTSANIMTSKLDSLFLRQNSNAVGVIKPQDSLLSNMDLPFSRRFYPLGFAVDILTNHLEVLEAANESFGHNLTQYRSIPLQIRIGVTECSDHGCPPEPIRREFNHLYSMVADPENQALLDLRTTTNFVWLNERALRNRLYLRNNFLEKVIYLLLGASVVTDIHAGCVSKNGKGILLCGDSGAGKSTLSYACARAGWTYTSDDTSYLINDGKQPRVIGHAHRVRFRPTAKSLFPELETREITPRMEGKASIEVPVCELPPINTSTEANVNSIVYLNRHSDSSGRLVALPHGSGTERLCKDLFSAGEIRAMHEKVLEKLTGIPTFELQYRSMDQAIEQLEELTSRL
jgi:hypothetical protein